MSVAFFKRVTFNCMGQENTVNVSESVRVAGNCEERLQKAKKRTTGNMELTGHKCRFQKTSLFRK